MAYLRDNQYLFQKKRKPGIGRYILLSIFIAVLVFLLRYFMRGFSYTVAVPVVDFANTTTRGLYSLTHSKKALLNRIEFLESENAELHSKLADYSLIENENSGLKNSILQNVSGIVASVVGKPGRSQYDTLLLDPAPGINEGMHAYSISGVPLGTVTQVTNPGTTLTLYSSPGIETNADIILNNAMESVSVNLIGRGGGAYESIVSKDVSIPVGSLAVMPGLFAKPMAEVVKIIERDDTKDQIVYLRSITNFQYLRYIILTN